MDSIIISSLFGLMDVLIGIITTIILQSLLTNKQIHNSFQLAAMDKRLEAHHKAYRLWNQLNASIYNSDESKKNIIEDAHNYWL